MKDEDVRRAQRLFKAYRHKKQQALNETICSNPAVQLLQALDLRFKCMRAVAAAKRMINKPIEDKEQAALVIKRAQDIAAEKGIKDIEAIATIFRQNITLAESIQSTYYNIIWTKTQKDGSRDLSELVNNAYKQLQQLILDNKLPTSSVHEERAVTSADVLILAREIIKHASEKIIDALGNPDFHVFYQDHQEELAQKIKQMLSNYMTPKTLSNSQESIHLLVEQAQKCFM